MRNFIFIIIFSIAINIQAQVKGEADYLIRYEVEFIPDCSNREDVRNEVHRLYTGSSVSYYASEASVLNDSIIKTIKSESLAEMRSHSNNSSVSYFTPKVYKDWKTLEVWVNYTILTDEYVYQEPNTPIEWEISDEIKEIGKYKAQKAITSFGGRDYEAWFTTEIPINDGPYVFHGLPGLILELYDINGDFQFNFASLVNLKEPYKVEIESISNKVSKEQVIKAYKKYLENPGYSITSKLPDGFEVTEADGTKVTKREIEKTARENAKKRSNQIEIW